MQDSVKQDRHKYIGGSDIPVIMGISPFKTRWQLLQEKAQIVEDTFEGNIFTQYGNDMEGAIRDYINETIGKAQEEVFVEGKHVEEGDVIGFRCHTDGETLCEILEVKTTSQIYENLDDYGLYLVQELFYMMRTNRPFGTLAVYERPEDLSLEFDPERLHIYRFEIDDYKELADKIDVEVDRFIGDLRELKANPFLEEQDFIPAELVGISDKLVALESQLEVYKKIEKQVKEFKAQLKSEMEKHGVKKWVTPTGYSLCLVDDIPDTTEEVMELDIEAMKQDLPELWKPYYDGGYMKPVQKTKKGKSGYVRVTPPKEK